MFNKFNAEYGNHVMDSFEFESGRVLENVNVEYAVSGTPKYDDEGNITNAVIYCPTLKGGYSILAQYHDLIKDNSFDKNEYCFIRIFSLGTPGSCSPSSTGLKYNFPQYTFKDRVNFKRQFLAEKFNLKSVFGLIGEGLGGAEALTWACEYPDDMEFVILLNTSYKTYGYRYIFAKCAESIIDSTDDFYSDEYSVSLSNAVVAINQLMFSGYFSQKIFESLSADELDVLMEDYVDEGLFMDIHDFKFRNDCIFQYDVEDKLTNIKSETLVLGIDGYLFYNPETEFDKFNNSIENSKVVIFHHDGDYYEKPDYSDVSFEIVSFLEKFKKSLKASEN